MLSSARRIAIVSCLFLLGACATGRTDDAPSAASSTPATPTATSAPVSPEEAAVASALTSLDRHAQVAQLFVAGVRLDGLAAGGDLVRTGIGGIFLAGRSQAPAADIAAATATWQAATPGPGPWIAVDQEGGRVQSLQGPGFERLPSALAQGGLPTAELAALTDRLGAALHDAGVNLDLAPVADVVPPGTAAGNPPIGAFDRQYGSTAEAVVAAAGTVVESLSAHGVTATLKHFPGLGRVRQNTDTAAHVVDGTLTADDPQVAAFGRLAGPPAHPFVMTSSAIYTQIDPSSEAAFSAAVVTDLLRGRLGFDGVVISDDLGSATAVESIAPADRAVRFLAAGGTLVLTVDASIVSGMIDAVLARADSDAAFAAQVDDAVRTALLAKARAGLLPPG